MVGSIRGDKFTDYRFPRYMYMFRYMITWWWFLSFKFTVYRFTSYMVTNHWGYIIK